MKTKLRVPAGLFGRVKRHVARNQSGSVNEFIVDAVTAYVRDIEREAIDDSFAGMAHDERYRREALRILKEFGG